MSSFFDQFQRSKKGTDVTFKTVKVAAPAKQQKIPRGDSSHNNASCKRSKVEAENLKRRSAKQRRTKRADIRFQESDDAEEQQFEQSKATTPVASAEERVVIDEQAFGVEVPFISSADITSGQYAKEYTPFFKSGSNDELYLAYPAARSEERYLSVEAKKDDDYSPMVELMRNIEWIAKMALPRQARDRIIEDGLLETLKRHARRGKEPSFRDSLDEINAEVRRARDDATSKDAMASLRHLDTAFVHEFCGQVYARAVAPSVDSLRRYEAFSNSVYGELLASLVSKMFLQVGLRSDKLFLDLGSGCGNVVLQAALETGCQSWGCEIMQQASSLARAQKEEFESRRKLWGLRAGEVQLVHGDFLASPQVAKLIPLADVVLCNNYAFDADLNSNLLLLFLDLKDGAKIISLKPFVPVEHVITPYNLESPWNLFRVEQFEYYSRSVSWTDAYGSYYITTKTGALLEDFVQKNQMN